MGKVDDLADLLHGNMAELTTKVATIQEGWEKLSAANIDITGRLDSLDRNQSEMSSHMSRMTEALTRIEATLRSDGAHRNHDDPQSSGVREVRNQNPIEPGGNQTLGYRGINNVLENRNAVLKKIELPSLDGSSPYGWISLAERFFRLGRYSNAERLDLLSITLKGPALHWFNREMLREPFTDWPQFKKRMIARFSQKVEENPGKRLFSLKQTGSIVDYVNEFEELTTIVTGIDEENLEHMFYIGLKQEMKEVMKMQKPRGLTNCFNTVISMEDSVFCKTMAEATNSSRRASFSFPLRSSSQYNFQGNVEQTDTNKSLATPEKDKPPWQSNGGKNHSGMLKLSSAAIAEKRRLGLCYKCPEKWSRGHQCQNMMLQVFTLIADDIVEITDEDWMEGFEEASDIVPELRELSLLSYLGVDSPAATTLWGEIGKTKVIVMIDSGASHNFIDPSVLERTRLAPSKNRKLEILLGTGSLVNGSGICKDVSIMLQSHEFTADFIVLELGNADIILGVQWLRTLGKCGYDWDQHEMSFMYKGEMITLFGDPELLAGRGNLRMLHTLSGAEQMGFGRELFEMNQPEVIQVIPEQRQQLLDKFVGVFAEPQQSETAQLMSYTVPENLELQNILKEIEEDVQIQEHVKKILAGKEERMEFQVVYGREPPDLIKFEAGSTTTFEIEAMLRERDTILAKVNEQLVIAQERLKLAARYYGPFEVLAKVGAVVYRLKLPPESNIHPVFHVSQLKPVLVGNHQVSALPNLFSVDNEMIIEPILVGDTRYDAAGHLEALVSWTRLPDHERIWVRLYDIKSQWDIAAGFNSQLEDKLFFERGGIVMDDAELEL